MNSPKLTVLMPVYNAEKYVRQAVESILSQTYKDFEFIIINDGSTDGSRQILETFSDKRIKIHNQSNAGVTACLNTGIEMAAGKYIARMDADDICLPERLALQVDFLDRHPDYAAVAVKIIRIDQNGNEDGFWSSDQSCVTPEAIRATLPKVNCLAHPGMLIRAKIHKKYRYNTMQNHGQDYDLWLRMHSDRLKIGKIDKNLLKLRVHKDSITARINAAAVEYKTIVIKGRYLRFRLFKDKRMTWFDCKVFIYYAVDVIRYVLIRKILRR